MEKPVTTTLGFINLWLFYVGQKHDLNSVYEIREFILKEKNTQKYFELMADIRKTFDDLSPENIIRINDGYDTDEFITAESLPLYVFDTFFMIIIQMILAKVNDYQIERIYIGYETVLNQYLEKNVILLKNEDTLFELEFGFDTDLTIEDIIELNKDSYRTNFYHKFLEMMKDNYHYYFDFDK